MLPPSSKSTSRSSARLLICFVLHKTSTFLFLIIYGSSKLRHRHLSCYFMTRVAGDGFCSWAPVGRYSFLQCWALKWEFVDVTGHVLGDVIICYKFMRYILTPCEQCIFFVPLHSSYSCWFKAELFLPLSIYISFISPNKMQGCPEKWCGSRCIWLKKNGELRRGRMWFQSVKTKTNPHLMITFWHFL